MKHRLAAFVCITPSILLAGAGAGICPCHADAGPTKGTKIVVGGPGGVLVEERWQAPDYCDVKPGLFPTPCEIPCEDPFEGWFACRVGWENYPIPGCDVSRHCLSICCDITPQIRWEVRWGCGGVGAYYLRCP